MENKRKRVFVMIRLFLIIILSLWLIVFIVHKLLTVSEMKKMKAEGIYNPVNVGGYDINVYVYGNENGKHTIVGMSGQGVNTFSMGIKPVTDRFSSEQQIAVVDRAGYGMSDSTTTPQTVDRIVEDYRTALKRAGCDAPYLLLAHSIGGLYATYWQSVYPDEIEGIIMLEGSMAGIDGYDDEQSEITSMHELFLTGLCNTGLQRVFHDSMKGTISWRNLTINQAKYAKAMEMHSTYTYAQHSESKLFSENSKDTLQVLEKTDIPKIYVTSQPNSTEEIIEYMEYRNASCKSAGKEPLYDVNDTALVEKMTENFSDACLYQNQAVSKFASVIGNCRIEHIGGIHNIYKQKPAQVASLLAEFIKELDK